MITIFTIIVVFVALLALGTIVYLSSFLHKELWIGRPRRPKEPGFKYVHVNRDGSVRELSPEEQAYVLKEYHPADGNRPSFKTYYEEEFTDWMKQHGLIKRRRIPKDIPISPVNPNYDALVAEHPWSMETYLPKRGYVKSTDKRGAEIYLPDHKLTTEEIIELERKADLEELLQKEAWARIDHTTI